MPRTRAAMTEFSVHPRLLVLLAAVGACGKGQSAGVGSGADAGGFVQDADAGASAFDAADASTVLEGAADVDAETLVDGCSTCAGDAATGDAAAPTGTCDGGYYLEISDEAGVQRFASACPDGGPSVPTLIATLCAEDTVCCSVTACGGSGSVSLRLYGTNPNGFCSPGSSVVDGTGIIADGGESLRGTVQIASLAADGGPVPGGYQGSVTALVDGGSYGWVPASGSFCVLYSP